MSSYWSGDMSLGCIIEGENIEYFKKKYYEKNRNDFPNMDEEEAMDALDDLFTCNESFSSSTDPEDYFHAQYYTDDTFEGLYFMSACPESLRNEVLEWRDDILYVPAETAICTKAVLNGHFYKDFKELKDEFIAKIGGYLPEDFNWDDNIGDLSYACFA